MQQETTIQARSPSAGRKPTHRLWMVEDREGSAHWTSLTGLFPTKKGALAGKLDLKAPLPSGARLVILPARDRTSGAA